MDKMTASTQPRRNQRRAFRCWWRSPGRKYEESEYWSLHLGWLLENKPQFVKRLFERGRGKLRMFLSQKAKQALDLGYRLQRSEILRWSENPDE
jgi:hypothetical protein